MSDKDLTERSIHEIGAIELIESVGNEVLHRCDENDQQKKNQMFKARFNSGDKSEAEIGFEAGVKCAVYYVFTKLMDASR